MDEAIRISEERGVGKEGLEQIFDEVYEAHWGGVEIVTDEHLRGLPQGANTSPILTELIMDK